MNIALITGATSGMGRRMVLELNDRIPAIQEFWLIGRREDRLLQLERELTHPVRTFSLDLTDPFSLSSLQTALENENPRILFLVNAAGFGKIGAVATLSLQDQLTMIDLNVRSLTGMCRTALPFMAPHSRIINFASSAAFIPQSHFSVYAASKSYVLSFSRSLNAELAGTGCYVTAVCPGPVKTEFFDIAETTGNIPAYKHLFMAKPERVCKKALIDSVTKQDISVYGLSMKALHVATKLLPYPMLQAIENQLNK